MKIGTTVFLFFGFYILSFNIYAKVNDVYDFQQFDDLNFQTQDLTFPTQSDVKTQFVMLKDQHCYVKNGFTPLHKKVSQIRLVFPTEILKEAWSNDTYQIGFAVNCYYNYEAMSNTNWYNFYQPNVILQYDKKYTSFSMDVGKCKRPVIAEQGWGWFGTGSRFVNTVEILFKHGSGKKKTMGQKNIRWGPQMLPVPHTESCGLVNNLYPFLISSMTDTS